MELIVKHVDGDMKVKIERRGGEYKLQIGDKHYIILSAEATSGVRSLLVDGGQYEVSVRNVGEDRYEVTSTSGVETVQVQDPLTHLAEESHDKVAATGPLSVLAYMPGRVVSILVEEGAEVTAGQGVVVLEAMKMENEIKAPTSGDIVDIKVHVGDTVTSGQLIMVIR